MDLVLPLIPKFMPEGVNLVDSFRRSCPWRCSRENIAGENQLSRRRAG